MVQALGRSTCTVQSVSATRHQCHQRLYIRQHRHRKRRHCASSASSPPLCSCGPPCRKLQPGRLGAQSPRAPAAPRAGSAQTAPCRPPVRRARFGRAAHTQTAWRDGMGCGPGGSSVCRWGRARTDEGAPAWPMPRPALFCQHQPSPPTSRADPTSPKPPHTHTRGYTPGCTGRGRWPCW